MPPERPSVVLVHGVGVSSRYMVPTAIRLGTMFHTYAPDLPGFGRSGKPPHVLDIRELADALAAWAQVIGLRGATLVGNSLGCEVIIDFALRYPALIDRAVLVGPTTDPRARSLLRLFGRGLLDMLLCEPFSYWPVLTADYLIAGPLRTVRTLRHGIAYPIVERLPLVQIPVLVVRGTCDPIAPQSWVEQMVELLPRGRQAVIPGASHAANMSAPDELALLVRSFVEERDSR
jgi:pimeloyl-ACP methyl ester carboxylesterase